jgi:hypothetical protein
MNLLLLYPGTILSCCAAVGSGALLRDAKPPGFDICGGADCPGACSPDTGSRQAQLPRARVCPKPGYKVGP